MNPESLAEFAKRVADLHDSHPSAAFRIVHEPSKVHMLNRTTFDFEYKEVPDLEG